MGISHALTEEFIIEDDVIFTDHPARYRMPSIKHVPESIEVIIVEQTTILLEQHGRVDDGPDELRYHLQTLFGDLLQ